MVREVLKSTTLFPQPTFVIGGIGVNGTLFDEIPNSKMIYEFSYFINAFNCSAFVWDNGSKVYIWFLVSQLPPYVRVTGTTVQLHNVIDVFVFLRLVNILNAVKDNFSKFNLPRPSRKHTEVMFMTYVFAYWLRQSYAHKLNEFVDNINSIYLLSFYSIQNI